MKTTNEQEQINEECALLLLQLGYSPLFTACRSHKEYVIYSEAYKAGRLKFMKEIEKIKWQRSLTIKDNDNQILMIERLKSSLQEKEQEIETLNNIISRGNEIRNNWENNEYQEATHYTWLDDQLHQKDQTIFNLEAELKSKLPDQEELREAIEAANFIIAWQVINPYPTEQVYLQLKTIKTFLESLKTTNGEG